MPSDDFDEALSEQRAAQTAEVEVSAGGNAIGFWAFGAVVCAIPIRLYLTPMFDMSLPEHGAVFAVVTLLGGYLLGSACSSVASVKEAELSETAKPLSTTKRKTKKGKKGANGPSKKELDEAKAAAEGKIQTKARGWSCFYNALWFNAMFLLTAFFVFPQLAAKVVDLSSEAQIMKISNYSCSVLFPCFMIGIIGVTK